jgi:hypothetical protein
MRAALMLIAAPAAQENSEAAIRRRTAERRNCELDATQITGSREQPTVMNILPWKHAPAPASCRARREDTLNEVRGAGGSRRVSTRAALRRSGSSGTQSKP